MWGNFDDALQIIKQTLLALAPDQNFAVYEQYRLEPSSEAESPELHDPVPEPGGEWVVLDRERRVASRLREWLDSEEPVE